jgi:hypothetical protein
VWLLGAESYLAVARAWLAAGDPARAAAVLGPLVEVARLQGWRPVLAQALVQQAATARVLGDPAAAAMAAEAVVLAGASDMRTVLDQATGLVRG